MKRFIQAFLFLIAFQMEVRVRASGEILAQPESCMKNTNACAIQVVGDAFHFSKQSLQFSAARESTLVRLSTKRWKFLKGALWIEKNNGVEVETIYGSLKSHRGQFWLLDRDQKIVVRNVDSDVRIELRDGKKLNLPEGFEIWISGIDSQGNSEHGILKPIDLKDHLALWNGLYLGSKSDFRAEVMKLKEAWGDLTEKSSRIYMGLVQRELASERERVQVLELEQLKKESEQKRARDLYWRKVFEQ